MYPISANNRTNGFVLTYFGLVLAIGAAAYTPYILASYGLLSSEIGYVCFVLGALSPTIAAVALTGWLEGKTGLKNLFSGFLRRGFSKKWFLAAFLLPLIVCACALVPWFIIQPNAGAAYSFNAFSLAVFPLLLGVSFLLGMWGEVGWRGFAQRRLQTRYNVLLSSFLVGFFWAVWQWPLFLVRGSSMLVEYQNPLLFGAFTLMISVVYAWIYNSTRGSLLVVSLFHASVGSFTSLLFFNSAIAYSVFPYYFVVVAVLMFGLIWRYRGNLWSALPKPA